METLRPDYKAFSETSFSTFSLHLLSLLCSTIIKLSSQFFQSQPSHSTPADIMNAEQSRIFRSSSLPKTAVRKWLNLKSASEEFLSDYHSSIGVEARRTNCSDKEDEEEVFLKEKVSGEWLMESAATTASLSPAQRGPDPPEMKPMSANDEISMFVGTWNVGGRSPNSGLDLTDWLLSSPTPADIFVLGFQEIVPLTASNVLGSEDSTPSASWLDLIRRALNSRPAVPPRTPAQNPRFSFSDLLRFTHNADSEDDDVGNSREPSLRSDQDGGGEASPETLFPTAGTGGEERYYLAASKQMVGIFLCVWLRAGLKRHVNGIKVSCIGRGILGFMGNKGSVSISMRLRRTAFCFVCTHLTSGEKDGDEIRRNSDVLEILKRTRFQNSSKFNRQSPETISEHDKIIWLGDLNYRLNSTGFCFDVHELLSRKQWQALLENDQLRIERNAGRVFAGWEEGRIFFPPTYKYLADSNIYAVNPLKRKDKRRTPAWCDRILWRGKGMKQMWYIRGESRFSDHRPVYSLFSINLDRFG